MWCVKTCKFHGNYTYLVIFVASVVCLFRNKLPWPKLIVGSSWNLMSACTIWKIIYFYQFIYRGIKAKCQVAFRYFFRWCCSQQQFIDESCSQLSKLCCCSDVRFMLCRILSGCRVVSCKYPSTHHGDVWIYPVFHDLVDISHDTCIKLIENQVMLLCWLAMYYTSAISSAVSL